MAKVLITGASGRIGGAALKHLDELVSAEDEISLLERRKFINQEYLKGRNAVIVELVPDYKLYDVAFHFAGNLHTSRGHDPNNFYEFLTDNVKLTMDVCRSAKRVIFASTDNVFSGMDNRDYKEDDKPNPPNNYYGQTKAVAEEIVLDNRGAVIRFQSPLGVRSNLIVDKVFDALDGKPSWPFWNDQFLRPSFIDNIFSVFKEVYKKYAGGIYHVSCSGDALSRAEIAKKVLDVYKHYNIERKIDSIAECPCDNPAFPKRLVLDTERTRKELGIAQFTDVDEALRLHVLKAKKPEAI